MSDKIIERDVKVSEFYRTWLDYLLPIHKLTKREMDVAAVMLMSLQMLSRKVRSFRKRCGILLSRDGRKRLATYMDLSDEYFSMLYTSLKRKKFITEEGLINPLYVPDIVDSQKEYSLTVLFKFTK